MPRQTLDREIQHLQDEVLLLGSMVEQAMLNAIDTLKHRDKKAARLVYLDDERINEKRYAIENRVLILFATQQPIAHDLRLLAAILEVITELERMGDYAKGIAKIAVRISDDETPIPIREITRMGDLAVSMLHRALSAFINEDVNMAYRIPKEDDLVDDLYNQVYHKNVNAMIANPEIIDHSSYIMWVVHNIERMADRVTNICERTIFIATGELLEIDISDDEWAEEDEI
ncbi:MAG: phosphate signaling complex protein PhoU [Brevefilum sp.]|nr:phosphate signaling complex protein PhoU [Brevefilum sp.]MDT8381659.1 phosphate signaling complex protein PhoU [Brevefilum sp.]MDW7753767.1 phosphate signaling complex protein PhoU [Brevefilum sp.]